MKILLIEDDKEIISFIKKGLNEEGYEVDYSTEADEAIYMATTFNYNLILLDIMLPEIDGIKICQTIRKLKVDIPIIMLTAKDDIDSKVKALDIGANDYITKPFDFSELLARIRVQLRVSSKDTYLIKYADLELNLLTKKAKRRDKIINLTSKEFALLELLLRNPNQVFSEEQIYSLLYSLEDNVSSNTVNVYIYRLRNKIDKPFGKSLIKTVRGIGFCINDD